MMLFLALVGLEFYAERIICEVSGDTLWVDATYHMRAAPGSKFCLLFPLPEEGRDFHLLSYENCAMKQQDSVLTMCLDFGEDSLVQAKVVYQQRFPQGVFRYITTTTQAWGKALDWAEFVVKTPWKASLSYGAEERARGAGYEYTVRIENFMPQEDLIIQRSKPGP